MKYHMSKYKNIEVLGLFGTGGLLILVALFLDPIGSSPDSGIIDLGPTGTRKLLLVFGLIFVVSGFGALIKSKR